MCIDKPVTLAIADDHPLFVEGLILLIRQYPEFLIAGTASNGMELMEFLQQNRVDIVITDLHMPFKDGLSTCREINALYPEIKKVVLSFDIRENVKEELKLAGVRNFLNKDIDPETLLCELRTLANIKNTGSKREVAVDKSSRISSREQEVISLITKGFTSSEIAESLFLSIHTVSQHRKNILNKLRLKNIKELVAYGVRNKL